MNILVTGGAGYIGSHCVLELLNAGHKVIVVDNLLNSKEESLKRVQKITGKALDFHKTDLVDKLALGAIFKSNQIDAVIHFAGLKAVGESVEKPLWYYHNNLIGSINLFELMVEHQVKDLVFSSSCTVYGDVKKVPITEDFPFGPMSPYGRTKYMIELMLQDLCAAHPEMNAALLRYFNPVGAHESGEIGEDPNGIPNNLMPYIAQVAVGKLEKVRVFGGDYPTVDGTGVRDYIHVVDLALGHLKALDKLKDNPGCVAYNLGTGNGSSVLEVIKAFEKASGESIPYEIVDRRPGDVTEVWADPSFAEKEIGWKAERDIHTMCVDSWRWQTKNPNGYE